MRIVQLNTFSRLNCFPPSDSPIVCIDSGIGGLHVFKHLSQLTSAPLVYVADYAGFPYGEKSPDVLRTRLIALIQNVYLSIKPSVIVLACNTATTVGIQTIRKVFPDVHFVGCIPAIKPAAKASKNGTIALLATPSTCKQPALNRLIQHSAGNCEVLRFPLKELAPLAEAYFLNEQSVTPVDLKKALSPLLEHPYAHYIDHIILGCTHYPFLLLPMQKIGHLHWNWIDSSEAVAQQAWRIWQQHFCAQSSPHPESPHSNDSSYIQFVYTVEEKNHRHHSFNLPQLQQGLTRFGFPQLTPQPWQWLKNRLPFTPALSSAPTLF